MRFIDKEMQRTRDNYTSKKYLIVDGYNVINAWSKLEKISKQDLEEARNTLINYIHEFSKMKGFYAYVVFDAYNVKGQKEVIEDYYGVKVVFTKENQTADSYIEKFIFTLSKHDSVYVVTNDYAEQQIILGRGCQRITARELIKALSDFKKDIRKDNDRRKSKYSSMNRLDSRLNPDVYEKLEKIRRRK